MNQTRTRSSRVFTISFPDALARQVEQVAKQEDRNISELFREAFRTYKLRAEEKRLEALRPIVAAGTKAATLDQIQQFVDEVRSASSRKRSK